MLVAAAAGIVAYLASIPLPVVVLLSVGGFGVTMVAFGLLLNARTTASGQKGISADLRGFDAAVRERVSAFFPSRRDYSTRPGGASIDEYIGQAQTSVLMVSITLATGVIIDDLVAKFRELLDRDPTVSIGISLLDYKQQHIMTTIAPVLDTTPTAIAAQIADTVDRLKNFQRGLPTHLQSQFELRLHPAMPSASAILIDHRTPAGRIQLETKPYKAAFRSSYAFEVRQGSDFYRTLVRSYEHLWGQAERVGP